MKTLASLFLLPLFLLSAVAGTSPKTITADSSSSVLLWPTNLFSVNSNYLWSAIGGDESGVLSVVRGGTGTNTVAGIRSVIGLDPADPGALGKNWLTLGTASQGRTALGFNATAPGAIGAMIVTNGTQKGVREKIQIGEWTTNEYFGHVMGVYGGDNEQSATFRTNLTGHAGVYFANGTNHIKLISNGDGLTLTTWDDDPYTNVVSPLDGSDAQLITYGTMRNYFVKKTNEVVLVNTGTFVKPPATNTMAPIAAKEIDGRVRLTTWNNDGNESMILTGEDADTGYVLKAGDTMAGELSVPSVSIGGTNVLTAIDGKQATNVVATYADLEAFTGPATVIAVANTNYGGLFTYTTQNPVVSEIANLSGGSGYTMTPTVFTVVAGGTGYTNGPATITIDSTAVDVSIVTAAGVITSVVPAGAGTLAAPTTDSWTSCPITQGAGADGTARASTWTPLTRNISGGTAVTPAVVTITRIRSGYPDIAFVSSSGEYTVLPGTEDTSKLYHTASLEVSGSEVSPTFRVYSAGRYGTWIPATGKGSGKWVRQNVSQIDVSVFGAVSDTTTDNTKALNAACVAARTFGLGLLFSGPGAVNASHLPTKGYLVSNRIDARQIYQLKMDAPIVVNPLTFNSTNIVLHVGGDTNDFNPYNLESIWIAGNANLSGTDTTNVAGLCVNQMMYSQVSVRQISRVGAGIRFEMTHLNDRIVANTWRIGNFYSCGINLHVSSRSSIPLGSGYYNEQVFIGGYWRASLWSTGYGTANIRLDRGLSSSKFYGCVFETDCPLVLGFGQLLTFSDIRIEKVAPYKMYYSIDPTTPYTRDKYDTEYPALIINPNTLGNRNRLTWAVRENEQGVVWLGEDSAEESSHSPTRLFQFPGPVKSSANNYLMFPGLIAWDLATKTRIDGDAIIESADETKPQGLRKWQMKSPSTAMSGKMFGMRFSRSNAGTLVLRVEGYDHGLYAQNLSANTHDAEFFAPRMAQHTAGTSLYYTFTAGGGDVFIPLSWSTFIIGIGDPGVADGADNFDGSAAPTIRVVVGDAIPIDDILISRPVVRELPDKGIVPPNAEYLSYANGDVFRAGPWISTTLAAQAVGGATTLTVASTDGLCAGDSFHLGSNYEYEPYVRVGMGSIGKIATIVDGTTLTVTPALATGTYPIGYGFKAQRWTTTKTIGQTSVADMLATVDPSKVSLNVGSHDSNDGMAGLYAPREVHTYDTSATNGWAAVFDAMKQAISIVDGCVRVTQSGTPQTTIGLYTAGQLTVGNDYVLSYFAKSDGNANCGLYMADSAVENRVWLTDTNTTTSWAEYAVAFTAKSVDALMIRRPAGDVADWLQISNVVLWAGSAYPPIASYTNGLPSAVNANYIWQQKQIQPVSGVQRIDTVGERIIASGDAVFLDPTSSLTLTATPTITPGVVLGQRITLLCTNELGFTVTLQDANTLAGTKLKLKGPTRTLTTNVTSTLVWDGFNWIETETSDTNTMYFASVNIGATNVVTELSGKHVLVTPTVTADIPVLVAGGTTNLLQFSSGVLTNRVEDYVAP